MLNSLLLLPLRVSVGGPWYAPVALSTKWLYWVFSGMGAAGWVAFSMKDKGNWSAKMPFSRQAPVRPWYHRCSFFEQLLSPARVGHSFLLAGALPAPRKCSSAGLLANLIVHYRCDTDSLRLPSRGQSSVLLLFEYS